MKKINIRKKGKKNKNKHKNIKNKNIKNKNIKKNNIKKNNIKKKNNNNNNNNNKQNLNFITHLIDDIKIDDIKIDDIKIDEKIYFLIYKDDTHNEYIEKLIESIKTFGKNFEIIIFNKKDIDNEFVEKNQRILNSQRGGGYWLWKPYIIYNTLQKLNDNDLLFYLDSKYYFIDDFRKLFMNYMESNDIMIWKNKPNEPTSFMKNYCKMDVIMKYNMYDKVFNKNAEDCWAGALILKKNEKNISYVKEWLDMCCIYENITDSKSIIKNKKLFIDHRHDQSLLSIIIHKYNIPMNIFEKKYLQNVRIPF